MLLNFATKIVKILHTAKILCHVRLDERTFISNFAARKTRVAWSQPTAHNDFRLLNLIVMTDPNHTHSAKQWSLDRRIAALAIPAIVSNVTVPLIGLSDTTISGHLGSEAALGAIAVGTMMTNVAYWLCGFLRMGTAGMTAEAFGAGDRHARLSVLWRAVLLGLVTGLVLILFRNPLCKMLLEVAGATPDVRSLAAEYYLICVCGAPAMLGTMALLGWMIGMQNTLYPMIVSVGTNLLNVGLSITCVFGLEMGFPGVAWGTCGAQWCGLILAFVLSRRLGATWGPLVRRGAGQVWRETLRGSGLGKFFRVNTDLFFRSFFIMAVSMSVTSFGARLGTVTLAANAVMMQFFIFFSYFMDGFAFAGEALAGRASGAGDLEGLRRVVRRLLMWSAGMALLFMAAYMAGGTAVASLITDELSVRCEIDAYRWVLWLIPPLSVAAFICDGFFIGMTKTRPLLWATFCGAGLFFACVLLSGAGSGLTNTRLWTGFLLYLLTRGTFLLLRLPRQLRSMR